MQEWLKTHWFSVMVFISFFVTAGILLGEYSERFKKLNEDLGEVKKEIVKLRQTREDFVEFRGEVNSAMKFNITQMTRLNGNVDVLVRTLYGRVNP